MPLFLKGKDVDDLCILIYSIWNLESSLLRYYKQNSNQKRRLLFKFSMSTKGEHLFTLNKTVPPGQNTLTKEERKRSTAWE